MLNSLRFERIYGGGRCTDKFVVHDHGDKAILCTQTFLDGAEAGLTTMDLNSAQREELAEFLSPGFKAKLDRQRKAAAKRDKEYRDQIADLKSQLVRAAQEADRWHMEAMKKKDATV